MSIHKTAIVSPGATIAPNVEIGPCTVIGSNVRLGEGCRIHHHVTVEGHTTLGPGCEVYPQAVLGMPPQDLKFSGERTTLEIGERNIFREMVTVHPGTGNGGGVTRIDDGNLFLIGVHVAHDCRVGKNCILANYVQLAGHVHLEDNVNIGGNTAIHHFVTVGKHAFVGGMTRVSSDVAPFMIVVAARGNRAEVRMVNGVGLQRSGYSYEDIGALKKAYLKLFSRRARLSGVAIRERVEELLESEGLNPHVAHLCEFLMRSFAHGRHGRYLESLRADAVHRDSWKPDPKCTLTVNIVGEGTVDQSTLSAHGDAHEKRELSARAEPGWGFAGWNGSQSSAETPISVVLDRDHAVTATFVKQTK